MSDLWWPTLRKDTTQLTLLKRSVLVLLMRKVKVTNVKAIGEPISLSKPFGQIWSCCKGTLNLLYSLLPSQLWRRMLWDISLFSSCRNCYNNCFWCAHTLLIVCERGLHAQTLCMSTKHSTLRRFNSFHFDIHIPLVLLRNIVATSSFHGSWNKLSCTRSNGDLGGVHFSAGTTSLDAFFLHFLTPVKYGLLLLVVEVFLRRSPGGPAPIRKHDKDLLTKRKKGRP